MTGLYCIYNSKSERYSDISISSDGFIITNRSYAVFTSLFSVLSGAVIDDIIQDLDNNYIIYEVDYEESDMDSKLTLNFYYETCISSLRIINTISYEEYVNYIFNNQDLVLQYVDYLQTMNSSRRCLTRAQYTLYSALYKMGLFRELIKDAAISYNDIDLLEIINIVDSIEKKIN